MAEIDPDWSIGAKEPSKRQIAKWEKIKSVVSPIGGGLYLSGFPDRDVQDKALDLGIQVMVSCTHAEPEIIPGMSMIRVPFDDNVNELPDQQQINYAVDKICELLDNWEPVLIHCMYGLNRSALVAAHVIAKRLPLMTGDQILAHLRDRRPGALHNALFASAVAELNQTSP
jgi:hypothetical protein